MYVYANVYAKKIPKEMSKATNQSHPSELPDSSGLLWIGCIPRMDSQSIGGFPTWQIKKNWYGFWERDPKKNMFHHLNLLHVLYVLQIHHLTFFTATSMPFTR